MRKNDKHLTSIQTSGLTKDVGDLRGVDNISLELPEGRGGRLRRQSRGVTSYCVVPSLELPQTTVLYFLWESRSPGWHARNSQMAERVEKRIARTRPFLRMERLTMVMPIASANSVRVIPDPRGVGPDAPRCCNRSRRASCLTPWLRRLRVTQRRSGKPLPEPACRRRRGSRPTEKIGKPITMPGASTGLFWFEKNQLVKSRRRRPLTDNRQEEDSDPAQTPNVGLLERVSSLYGSGHSLNQPKDRDHQ